MSSGCGCKEVYRFPHITYPYSSCIFSFCSSIHTFSSSFQCFLFLLQYIFVIYLVIFSRSINKHTGDYGHPTVALRRVAHNVLYAKHTQTYT